MVLSDGGLQFRVGFEYRVCKFLEEEEGLSYLPTLCNLT
jgi:hypothetical protein